jgi:hypothetical protein
MICLLVLLAACGSESGGADGAANSADDGAAAVVEAFWEAKVAGNADALAELMCAELEADVEMQALSFASVDARIEAMACSASDTDSDATIVTCDGQIIATYGTEDRDFPLGSARVVQEAGEWKWCGEAEVAE